ncbi:MAG: hypothetical protein VX910_04225 [Candidatus Latescibacterota bacterium]|nr:hypothetical protein [Candidatus Latescibacterota bacterium]
MIEEYAQPIEVGRIDIQPGGNGCRVTLGDLNGDGRMEFLTFQPDGGIDDRYVPHEAQCLTAFGLSGDVLWQVGSPDPDVKGSRSDIPVQIHDIDGDGKLEVLCVMGGKYRILDGATGHEKQAFYLPDQDAHDCIVVCNLTGDDHSGDVILKDRYRRVWALDRNWDILWQYEGNPGHYPWPHDFDGDGRDEIMAGYDLLDHDGSKLWSCRPLDDHADCMIVCRPMPDIPGDQIAIGGSVTVLYSHVGKELWRYEGSKESQHVAVGQFRESESELQIVGLDRIERGKNGIDGMFLLSSKGEEIWKEDRQVRGWLTIVSTLSNWDGTGKDHILAYRRRGGLMPSLYDGEGLPVVTFPLDGYVVYADLFGRDLTDVLIYVNGEARVYSSEAYDLDQPPPSKRLPHPKRLSHQTLYPGGEYPSE